MPKKFQKRVEDFTCEHCGFEVRGTGFTNHCPHCLWAKHVDINPGDRLASCHGLMKPVSLETRAGEYVITHRCETCGFERKNKAQPKDSFQKIIEIGSHSDIVADKRD